MVRDVGGEYLKQGLTLITAIKIMAYSIVGLIGGGVLWGLYYVFTQ